MQRIVDRLECPDDDDRRAAAIAEENTGSPDMRIAYIVQRALQAQKIAVLREPKEPESTSPDTDETAT